MRNLLKVALFSGIRRFSQRDDLCLKSCFEVLVFNVSHKFAFLSKLEFAYGGSCAEDRIWEKLLSQNKIHQTAFSGASLAYKCMEIIIVRMLAVGGYL